MTFSLARGCAVLATCCLLLACGSNPELIVPPTETPGSDGGSSMGGAGDDDPLNLGGALEGMGGNDSGMMPGPKCGDAVVDADESCDDGNSDDSDGCSDTCQIEEGF